jgi:Na+/melibiose symporter-like transporter
MLKMLRVVEVVWAGMAVYCLYEFVRLFNAEGDQKWGYGGFMLVSIFMFFFRRRTRRRYDKVQAERENSKTQP